MTQELYDNARHVMQEHIDRFRSEILGELRTMMLAEDASKDILIVVHNELDCVRNCIESIRKHTKNYRLFIWDNASDEETRCYLREVKCDGDARVIHSRTNMGFGEPNNKLAQLTRGKGSDYLILLNSDTQVFDGWDRAMIGHLQTNPDCAQVGYQGCLLSEKGYGGRVAWGSEIDYVAGFCSCISRATYRQFNLFDPAYEFAYCEDADFSLRLWAAGCKIYALHLLLVHHFENRTIKAVVKEGKIDVMTTFQANHDVLRTRWADYLANHRIDTRKDSTSDGQDARL